MFDHLPIAKTKEYLEHLNSHNVIYIDFGRMPENCSSYHSYMTRISDGLKEDLQAEYPELDIDASKAVWDVLSMVFQETRQTFTFVIDEWDALFHMSFITDGNKREYLLYRNSSNCKILGRLRTEYV